MEDLETIAKETKGIQGTVNELLSRFKTLSKFEEAAIWDNDTDAAIHIVEQYTDRICQFVSNKEQALADLSSSRGSILC